MHCRLVHKIQDAHPLRPVFERARHRQRREVQIPMAGRQQLLRRSGFLFQFVDEDEARQAERLHLRPQPDELASNARSPD